jgi:hypothetical protein
MAETKVPVAEVASGDRSSVCVEKDGSRFGGIKRNGLSMEAVEVACGMHRTRAYDGFGCICDPRGLVVEVERVIVCLAEAEDGK